MITDGLSTICCDYSSVSDVCVCVCVCVSALSHTVCPALCDPRDCSPPGSSAHAVLQARTLEWVANSSPGDLPDPGTELPSPVSPALQVGALALCLLGTCCSASFPVPLVSPQASPFLLH